MNDHEKLNQNATPKSSVDKNIDKYGKQVDAQGKKIDLIEKKDEKQKALLNKWRENPENKERFDDPRMLALHEIVNPRIKREVYLLLGLLKENWGQRKAREMYVEARNARNNSKNGEIDLKVFHKFFEGWETKELSAKNNERPDSSRRKLGFYYNMDEECWYAWDENGSKDDEIGKHLVDGLHGNKKGLLYELGSHAEDSGISIVAAKKIHDSLKADETRMSTLDYKKKEEIRGELLKTFKKSFQNSFGIPKPEMIAKLNLIYGAGVAGFKYRYMKQGNTERIYCLSMGQHEDGYIDLNEDKNKLEDKWVSYDETLENEGRTLQKDMFIKMPYEQFENEYFKVKPEAADGSRKLDITKGWAKLHTKVAKKPQVVSYKNIQIKYLDRIEKSLVSRLMMQKYPEESAKAMAKLRVDDLKAKIDAKIEGNEKIKLALKDKGDLNLKISIDSNDDVSVDFANKKSFEKYKGKIKDLKEKGKETVEDLKEKQFNDISDRIAKKFPKNMRGIVKWFLTGFLDLKKELGKKGSLIGGIVLSMFGMKKLKDKFKARKVDQKAFDDLLGKNDKEKVVKKKLFFKKNVKLNNLKIVIPKGGIKAGGSLSVLLKSGSRVTAESKKSSYQFKDEEITIPAGTEIPKDTVLAKGAKIVRV
jgi:hypothetical protein